MRADNAQRARSVLAVKRSYGARMVLLAWALTVAFVSLFAVTPEASADSTMRARGAFVGDGQIGIISHRGAANLAPENTLAAMRVALDNEVDFVETDVQLTSDGVPVLMHDDTVDRTTDGSGRVSTYTAAQIAKLDAGSWFGGEYAGERVPTLDEFVDLLGTSNTRALVELKGVWPAEAITEVTGSLRARGMVNRIALQSFEIGTLETLASDAPEFALVMLTRTWDSGTMEDAVRLKVSAVGARIALIDRNVDRLDVLAERGIGAMTYTLDTKKRWKQAISRGIDLIITNEPVALAKWREEQHLGEKDPAEHDPAEVRT